MPVYVFTVDEGHHPAESVRQHFEGPEQARSEAVLLAGSMLRDADGQFWDAPEWRLRVNDEQGATVCALTVAGPTRDRSRTKERRSMTNAEAEDEEAYARGKHTGASRASSAGTCPYTHDQLGLRMAWFDGFSAGRAALRAAPSAEERSDQPPEPPRSSAHNF